MMTTTRFSPCEVQHAGRVHLKHCFDSIVNGVESSVERCRKVPRMRLEMSAQKFAKNDT